MNKRGHEQLPDTPYRDKIQFAYQELKKVDPEEAQALVELMVDERFTSTEIMHGIVDTMREIGFEDFTLTSRAVSALRVLMAFNGKDFFTKEDS